MSTRTTSQGPGLAKVVEKQMRNWELARTQRPGTAAPEGQQVHDFVTIANIVGAGGNEVAGLLAEKLGWPLFDRQILTNMAGDDEVRAQLYRSMDERDIGWCENLFRSLMQQDFRKNDYFHRLTETILCLARQAAAVFVGRAADLILPRSRGLRVKVVASPERCAENFAKRSGTTLEHARKEVERIERERKDFIRNHFHRDAYDPTRFDLLINIEQFTPHQAADLVFSAMRLKGVPCSA